MKSLISFISKVQKRISFSQSDTKKKSEIVNVIATNIFIACIMLTPIFVMAQAIGLQNPINVNSISDLILIVTRVVRYIAIPFVVIMIMYAGFQFIVADQPYLGGWTKANAKTTLWYTVIGAFILLSAELIALVMRNTIEGLTR